MALHLHLSGFASALVVGRKTHQLNQTHSSVLLVNNPPSQTNLSFSLSYSALSHTPKRPFLFPLISNQSSTSASVSTLDNRSTEPQQQQQQQQEQQKLIPDRKRLIAQNIPWTSTAEDIRSLFKKYGTVTDVELSMYSKVKNRGLAFITMGSEEEAAAALNNLNSYEMEGRMIKVEYSTSMKRKPSTETLPGKRYDVYVGNLAYRVKSEDLREFLSSANGNLLRAEVVYQTDPRRSAGYGFVSFGSMEEAEAAIAAFDGKELMGRPIRLGLSKKDMARANRRTKDDQSKGEMVEANDNAGAVNSEDDLDDASNQSE